MFLESGKIEQIAQRSDFISIGAPELISPQASERMYWRLRNSEDITVIISHFSADPPENLRFVEIAKFLKSIGILVPEIIADFTDEGWLILEDLGSTSLFDVMHSTIFNNETLKYYQEALQLIRTLQTKGPTKFQTTSLDISKSTTEGYIKEAKNFWLHCLHDYLHVTDVLEPTTCYKKEFQKLAEELSNYSPTLIHRDFQSKNIYIKNGELYVIDFQGMRWGVPEYDIASLIYDPYVYITDENRLALTRASGLQRELLVAAAQRLIQALWVYSFLGVKKQKTDFLRYIDTAINRLVNVLNQLGSYPYLHELLSQSPKNLDI